MKPKAYLDKGAIGVIRMNLFAEFGWDLCYSEATLMDMKNDRTSSHERELDALSDSKALYLFRDGKQVLSRSGDSREEFARTDRLEVEVMANLYRFINGGGPEHSLWDVLQAQIDRFSADDPPLRSVFESVETARITDAERIQMQEQLASDLRRGQQRATKSWNQNATATLADVFEAHPKMCEEIEGIFPKTPGDFEQVHVATMMLGALQLGQDKGITSPQEDRSRGAAERGYIDCLHIAFGLHCDLFITNDKATFRRFQLLNDFWKLGKIVRYLGKQIP